MSPTETPVSAPSTGREDTTAPEDRDRDELVRTLSRDGSVLVRAFVATELVARATEHHEMAPTARSALGLALVGAVLLAVGGKDSESVQVEIRGNGPLRSLIALSDPEGRARGYVANPAADPPPLDGKLDIASAIGVGLLTVSRHRPSWREPHTGTVALATSRIAEDLTHYLSESEQIPSALGLATSIDAECGVESAGGFLVQALPGADDAIVAQIEANVRGLGGTAELFAPGRRGNDVIDLLLAGVGSRERHSDHPEFHCPCTAERALRTLSLLGGEELGEMVAAAESQEVRCQFCGRRYDFRSEDLRGLLNPV
jgi:molecular chaperone Hsp33